VDDLSSLLLSIESQLTCVHTEVGGAYEEVKAQEGVISCAEKLLHDLSDAATHCDEDRGKVRDAQLQQLEDTLTALCKGQSSLTSSLSSLRRDLDAVTCQLGTAEGVWGDVSHLYSTLLLCRREAKELTFLDWADRQLSHYDCTAHETHEDVQRQSHHLHSLQRHLSTLQSTLQHIDSSHVNAHLICTSSTTCTSNNNRIHVIASFIQQIHLVICELEQQAGGVGDGLHRINGGLSAQLVGLADVDKAGCEVELVIRQWRAELERLRCDEVKGQGQRKGQGKGEGCEGEEEWRKAILHGLVEMGKALDFIHVQEGVISGQLTEAKCSLDNIDGCGLVHVEQRGLKVAGVYISV
jgi:hypothetical protein